MGALGTNGLTAYKISFSAIYDEIRLKTPQMNFANFTEIKDFLWTCFSTINILFKVDLFTSVPSFSCCSKCPFSKTNKNGELSETCWFCSQKSHDKVAWQGGIKVSLRNTSP